MKPVTLEQAAQIQAAKQAANVPQGVRRQIGAAALASQHIDMSKYYYSRIRFEATLEVGAVTFASGERYAFSYQVRQLVDTHTGHLATYADTNLIDERSTNKGETAKIRGMSVRHTPLTDAYLAAIFDMVVSVSLRLDNTEIMYLGNPSDIPGSSQLAKGPTFLIPFDAESNVPPVWHPALKGQPHEDNMIVFAEPIIWRPDRNDSKLDVKFRLEENLSVQFGAARAATDVKALGAGDNAVVTAWSPPTKKDQPGTFVDYWVKLYVETESPRSVNQ